MAALSKIEIQQKLKEMHGWSHVGKAIQKKYTLKSFMPAIGLVNKIGHRADSKLSFRIRFINQRLASRIGNISEAYLHG